MGKIKYLKTNIVEHLTDESVTSYINDGLVGKEVYQISDVYTSSEAGSVCAKYGGILATSDQLRAAQKSGAAWCSWGWVSDSNNTVMAFPMQEVFPIGDPKFGWCNSTGVNANINNSKTDKRAVNCYGIKPPQNSGINIQPFYTSPLSPPANPTKYNSPTVAKYLGKDPDTTTNPTNAPSNSANDSRITQPSPNDLSSDSVITQTSTVLQNLSNTTNPQVISKTLNDLSSTLQSQNVSSSFTISDPETKSTIYSYYASKNPTLDTNLPLAIVSTTKDSNGNQIIDPESLPVNSSTSTNILIPLDPGKSITMKSVTVSRGSLSDGTNSNQSNQIRINDGSWLNYNEKVTVGNNTFLFVGSGSPIIMQILPASQSNNNYYIIGTIVVLVLIILIIIYMRNSNNNEISTFDKYGE